MYRFRDRRHRLPLRITAVMLAIVAALIAPAGTQQICFAVEAVGDEKRLVDADELDQLLMVLTRQPPKTYEIEIFSAIDKPKKTREELERICSQSAEEMQAAGRTWSEKDKKHWIAINVQGNLDHEIAPRLARERFVKRGEAKRIDMVSSGFAEGEITPSTPFWETVVEPGDWKARDRRSHGYCYGNTGNPPASAWTKENSNSSSIRDIWRELVGCEPLLQDLVLAMCSASSDDSQASSAAVPWAGLSPEKTRAFLQGEADLVLRVAEIPSEPDQRLAISVEVRSKGILSFGGRYSFATITVDKKDFRRVLEQTFYAANGDVVLKVTADGFDAFGIPREKIWERRRPDGLWEKTSYLILKADTDYDAPPAEFDFNPPTDSKVYLIGKDGWGTPAIKPELPLGVRPTNWLWGLNLLAVLVLAAFTIRKLLLRRQTDVGGTAQ